MNVNDSHNTSRTDWDALAAMTDADIDYSDIPPLTDEFFAKATLRVRFFADHKDTKNTKERCS